LDEALRDSREFLPLIGCHDCDAVVEEPRVPNGGSAICQRCGGTLFRRHLQTVEVTLALAVSAWILLILANTYPLLVFELQGQTSEATLASGVSALWRRKEYLVSGLVFLTTMFAPACQVLLLLFVLAPLHFKWRIPGGALAFRWVERFRPWSMMEVFLIGIMVALVKLSEMANIRAGLALWAFLLLIPTLAGALAFLDPEIVWRRIEEAK
jgi:paraquat-inducible protein A